MLPLIIEPLSSYRHSSNSARHLGLDAGLAGARGAAQGRPVSAQTPILSVHGVGKRFGAFVALNDVTVAFPAGQLTAIIGPNGAGKSTFFNLNSGAFAPSSGRVVFEGRDITGLAQHQYARMRLHHRPGRHRAQRLGPGAACRPRDRGALLRGLRTPWLMGWLQRLQQRQLHQGIGALRPTAGDALLGPP